MSDAESRLPLIGRDRIVIDKLAKQLHRAVMSGRPVSVDCVREGTKVHETPRGSTFDVLLDDGYVAAISVAFKRREQPRRQQDAGH